MTDDSLHWTEEEYQEWQRKQANNLFMRSTGMNQKRRKTPAKAIGHTEADKATGERPAKRRQHPEADFTAQVIELAHLHGWLCAHFRPGMTQSGKWATAVQGDGKGFLDLLMVQPFFGRVIAAELKVGKGKMTPEQFTWYKAWERTAEENDGIGVYCWWPEDMDKIIEILKGTE